MANGSDISIPAPEDVSSASYQAELAEVEMEIGGMTESERASVNYWTNNSAIRWNEIALELIAKYNLIPGPNDDGSYTLPNPNNPDGPPPTTTTSNSITSRSIALSPFAR